MNLSDWIGFTGVTILLIAFLLNLLKKISANSLTYILMNISGAGLACLASVMINYIPFIILEAAWTLVSVVTLIRTIAGKKTE
jgi:hypothetical protein